MTTPELKPASPVTQDWTHRISMMQQSVLLGAIRGPDGVRKYHPIKPIVRWLRRCVLHVALTGEVMGDPLNPGGGSFTGPSVKYPVAYPAGVERWEEVMEPIVDAAMKDTDDLPHHFLTHLMHAAEILGYKHPNERIGAWWHQLYLRIAYSFHLWPETEQQLNERLGDTLEGWLSRSDKATVE